MDQGDTLLYFPKIPHNKLSMDRYKYYTGQPSFSYLNICGLDYIIPIPLETLFLHMLCTEPMTFYYLK